MSGIPAGAPPPQLHFSSFLSATKLSVVSIIDAILSAFCNALLVTFVGSTTPAFFISSYFSALALNPTPLADFFTSSTITAGSNPAFLANLFLLRPLLLRSLLLYDKPAD